MGVGGAGGPGVVRGVSRKKEQVTSKKIHRLQLSLLPCLVFKTAKGSESASVRVSRARWKQAEESEMYAVIENHLAEQPAFQDRPFCTKELTCEPVFKLFVYASFVCKIGVSLTVLQCLQREA